MNKGKFSDRYMTISVLVFFGLALLVVGAVLRDRIGTFVNSYTELQVKKQAETHALLMADKLDTELENLSYIAGRLEAAPDDMDSLMPEIYSESGVKQGLLSIDGNALYGDNLDVSVFDGIQSSFRGKKVITYVSGEGMLFTCPVFHGPNIRYVLYRLCPTESLGERFATEIYDDLGKFCVTTRDGHIIVPFYNSTVEEMEWYQSDDIRDKYISMHLEMEVSVAAARGFSTDRGEMMLFESEIPGTDFLVSGYVPGEVAAEGVEKLTMLVVWVFGLLMILVLIGAFYLTRASIQIRESDELREAKALAEEASRAKSDFLANMSHEIRTPINAVLGMNEMILRESNDNVIITYASNIKAAGNSLLGIINDILDFSKIEAGKIEIIPVAYKLPVMLNDLVNMIRTRAEDKGLKLILEFDPLLPKGLFGDEVRVKQVITNLLTNAVKYTEKGSVTFGMHYALCEDDRDSIILKVYVQDTGIGIKTEDLKRLFSEFERIEERRNRNIEGTGLGMSITRNLLEKMGSSLDVKSIYGEGSIFSFELKQRVTERDPIGDYEESYRQLIADREKYHERFTAPEARFLVVDDNNMNLMVFKSLVKKTCVQIDTAESGDKGIALSASNKYDIMFLDHMMPEKDGVETLQEIRGDADNPNVTTPAVCLTANAIAGARDEYIKAGFDDYLAKPIDPNILERMIVRFLPEELVKVSTDIEEEKQNEALTEEFRVLIGTPINTDAGLKNSGTPESYRELLKIFYNSVDDKAEEINSLYKEKDLKNYTIKIHALKSSAKIIGAAELGEEAQKLEDAGKEENFGYIRDNHERFLKEYFGLKEILAKMFPDEDSSPDRPEAGPELMNSVFSDLREAAHDMDCDRIEDIMAEVEGYSIPEEHRELFRKIRKASEQFDYKVIEDLLAES